MGKLIKCYVYNIEFINHKIVFNIFKAILCNTLCFHLFYYYLYINRLLSLNYLLYYSMNFLHIIFIIL